MTKWITQIYIEDVSENVSYYATAYCIVVFNNFFFLHTLLFSVPICEDNNKAL